MYGYMGKVIVIDLSSKTIESVELEDVLYRRYLGGEALGAYYLNMYQPAGADPFGPDNIIGFLPGLLAGTGVPASSRTMIVTKSPLTGGWGDSNSGGAFAPEIKSCGYDGIFIKGISPRPVYLLLTENSVELKDASHLWSLDTVDTKNYLVRETGISGLKVAAIGPAGENLSLISSVILDGRAAARSGVGAIMGAKRLKAVALKGKRKVQFFDKESIKKMNRDFRKHIMEVDYFVIDIMRKYGSCGFVSLGTRAGIAPNQNWQNAGEKYFPNHWKLDGNNVLRYLSKKQGCHSCPIQCGGTVAVDEGPYKIDAARLPEYETLVAFGNMVMNEDVEAVFKLQSLCDRYGIDTISTGTVIAYAIECFENGVLTLNDTDGIQLKWGNTGAIVALAEKIVKREGIGGILADGVKIAANKIGGNSQEYAVQIGGQELPFHDFRYEAPARGTHYISDPTPSRHERCSGGQLLQLNKSLGPYPELKPAKVEIDDIQGLGEIYAKGSMYYQAFSACGLCAYVLGAADMLPLVDIIVSVTGWGDYQAKALLEVGERSQILRQRFNLREGVKNYKFPRRLLQPPKFEGPMRGSSIDYDWNKMRQAFYKGYGWDPQNGEPDLNRMKELEMVW